MSAHDANSAQEKRDRVKKSAVGPVAGCGALSLGKRSTDERERDVEL
jgi:hypothetical protein